MNEVKVFNDPTFGQVRVDEDVNGEIWFCAMDVCNALGYENGRDAVAKHVDTPDVAKRYIGVVTGKRTDGSNATQNVQLTFVNESGLYSLIFGSKLERAKKFKKWVTSEVLPSIRKTGQYSVNMPSYQIEDSIARAQRWIEEQKEMRRLEEQNKTLSITNQSLAIENAQMKPKSDYFDDLVEAQNALGFRETAKILNIGQNEFMHLLETYKYIYRDAKKKPMPYAEQVTKGLFVVKECKYKNSNGAGSQVFITTKGRDTFCELFDFARSEYKNKSMMQRIKDFFGFDVFAKDENGKYIIPENV